MPIAINAAGKTDHGTEKAFTTKTRVPNGRSGHLHSKKGGPCRITDRLMSWEGGAMAQILSKRFNVANG